MTKYILHGGALKKDTNKNKKYIEEVAKDLSNGSIVLFMPLAREEEKWNEYLEITKKSFAPFNLKVEMASTEIDEFTEQSKKCNAVFMLGGDTHKLLDFLKTVPGLEKLWKNKTIAGSSAGAQVVSKYFYGNDSNDYYEGLGFLDIKVFVHWSEDKADKLKKLEAFGKKLEVIKIPEENFAIINK